jgi:hypothetical protein
MVGWYLLHLQLWSELDADFSITVMIVSSKLEFVTIQILFIYQALLVHYMDITQLRCLVT